MKKIRTVCVLGGTGFVGRQIVARLAAKGYQVIVPSRHRERHRELLVLPPVTVVEANVHDPNELTRLLGSTDAVINLVGILNEQGADSDFESAHVALARKLALACKNNGITRLLHMSALNADAEKGPSKYLRSKGTAEDLVHAAEGLNVTSFRPSVIFGPEDSFFNRFAGLLALTPLAFPLACPNARFAPVYVGDVADAYLKALENPQTYGQRYDLCGPRSYTLKELVEYTAAQCGLRREVIGLGDGLSRLQARIMEWVPGKPFSRDNYQSLQVDAVCSGPFPAVFGIQPASIEAIVPGYLGRRVKQHQYQDFRRGARRD